MTRAEALSQLMQVAGELVRCEGIPDPEDPEYEAPSYDRVLFICRQQRRRAKLIRDAVEVLRTP